VKAETKKADKPTAARTREAGMMDQKVVETALRDASRIVADYFRSEPRDVDKTIVKLSEVLDNHKLAAAVQRLEL
jgi:phage gp36-like protein